MLPRLFYKRTNALPPAEPAPFPPVGIVNLAVPIWIAGYAEIAWLIPKRDTTDYQGI